MPATKETTNPPTKRKKELAEYKYIGDDGGRWVFENRINRRILTIDKPKNLPAKNPSSITSVLTVHGFGVPESLIALCKK